MRLSLLAVVSAAIGEAVAACAANNCLRAVQRVGSSRNGTADCLSYLLVTVTPATSTHYSTIITSTTTARNVTATFNFTTTVHIEPSKRWYAQHEALDYLHGTPPLEGRQVTVSPTESPKYASACTASNAYVSACSCVGVTRQTITVATPTVTSVVTVSSFTYRNTTVSTRYFNSTATAYRNSSTVATSDATVTSGSNTERSIMSTTESSSSTTGSSWVVANSTSSKLFVNSTTSTLSSSTTSPPVFSNTTSGLFLNSTSTTRGPFQNTTMLNSTTTAPPYHNTTSPPLLNSTSSGYHLNSTTGRWQNSTSTGRWLNATSTGRWLNSSSTISSSTRPTATKTIDKTCGETAQPFAVRVGQADGPFDGWFLRVSGDAILLTQTANKSSQFSVEGSGRLCAVGRPTEYGNAAIAVVETADAVNAGSMVYFVDGLAALNLTERGYGDLECTVAPDLRCAEGELTNWVACGLQLEVARVTGGEVDGMNCTAVQLAPIYGSS